MTDKADDEGIIDLMRREIEGTYTSRDQRAAYRAGLSTAAAICDEVAARARAANPGRKKGSTSSVGEYGAGIAESCGDRIAQAREEIKVDPVRGIARARG